MKTLSILLIVGAVVMGIFDGGDVSGALVLGYLFLPAIFERKERIKGGKSKRGCY